MRPRNWCISQLINHRARHQAKFKNSTTEELVQFVLTAGKMVEDGSCVFDASLLPANRSSPIFVLDDRATYICDKKLTVLLEGHWLININGTCSIRLVTGLPEGMIKIFIADNSFECAFSDIEVIACMRSTTVSN